MNNSAYDYTLDKAVVGGNFMESIDNIAKRYVGQHYLIASAIIVVLLLIVIWFVTVKCVDTVKEKFNPTTLMRYQIRDGLGERATGGPSKPASPNMQCPEIPVVADEPWSWLANEAAKPEQMSGGPLTDAKLSKIMAGY